MSAAEGEVGVVVVKSCGTPPTGGMALQAIGAEAVGDMIGFRNPFKIRLVAGIAIRRRIGIAVGMAINALQTRMGTV